MVSFIESYHFKHSPKSVYTNYFLFSLCYYSTTFAQCVCYFEFWTGDSSIIELNVKVNQLVRTDIEECVNIDTTTDAKTCDGPFSLVNKCVKFEKLSDSGGSTLAITDKGPDGCGYSNQCGRCEGDCDNDSDCTGDLTCYQRTRSTAVVPGCSSTGT